MYSAMLPRIDFSGFFVAFPAKRLSAAVAGGHEFALRGYVASGADIIGISIWENHHFRNRHLESVTGKKHQEISKQNWRERSFLLSSPHVCARSLLQDALLNRYWVLMARNAEAQGCWVSGR